MQEKSIANTGLKIDPKIFLLYAYRHWYLILLGLTIGLVYAYFQVRYTPQKYSVNSRMLVKDEYSSWGQEYFLPGMELVSGRNRLINEIGIIKSYPLLEKVAKQLDRRVSYYKLGNIKSTELYPKSDFTVKLDSGLINYQKIYIDFPTEGKFRIASNQNELNESKKYHLDKSVYYKGARYIIHVNNNSVYDGDEFMFKFNTIDGIIRGLQSSLVIDVENQESSILIISQSGPTPQKSIDFLNTLMKTYIKWGIDQNNEIASNTIDFVDKQLRVIADSLVLTEYQLEEFQKKNFKDRILINEDKNNLESVFELEDILTKRNIQKQYYMGLINSLKQENIIAFPSAAVFGFQDPNIDLMIHDLRKTLELKNEAAFRYKDENPQLTQFNNELESQRNSLIRAATYNLNSVNGIIDSIQNIIRLEEGKVMKIPAEQREYLKIKRKNKLSSDLYTFLLNKRSEASIAKASNVSKVQILDFANRYRIKNVGPEPSSIYTFSIFMGLAIPLGLILLIYFFNNKIVDPSDLTRITNIPVIGTIGHKPNLDNNLVINENLKSVISESFRNIRTNLSFLTSGKKNIKVLVTSSISGEGKTFTSINLASIYAASGKKTILIGADLRKPKIADDFKMPNTIGLSTYLINNAELADIIKETEVKGLDLILSGPVPPNPAELLEGSNMKKLIEELEQLYEVIIIDSPPLGLVIDALLLKDYVDAGIYIVRHNFTNASYLEKVNQLFLDGVFNKVGIVVNAVKNKGLIGLKGSYRYYGYGYGYGYGYYTEDDSKSEKIS